MDEHNTTTDAAGPDDAWHPNLGRIAGFLVGICCILGVAGAAGYLLAGDPAAEMSLEDRLVVQIHYLSGERPSLANAAEIDLGHFYTSVYYPKRDLKIRVDFHLAVTVAGADQSKFKKFLVTNQHQMRDQILNVVGRAKATDLADPRLVTLRAAVVDAMNRMTDGRLVREVFFSDYSILEQ